MYGLLLKQKKHENMWGAIIGAGLGLASTALTNRANKKAQQQQVADQRALNKEASERSLSMWRDTNYKAQVEEAKKAGLNPAILYGGSGGGGVSTNIGSGGSASQASVQPLELGSMLQLETLKAQKELIEAQKTKTEAEANKIAGVDTQEAETRIADLTAGIDNKKAQEALTIAQTSLQNINNEDLLESRNDRMEYIRWEASKAYRMLGVAEDEAYISRETREEKIKQINTATISGLLTNVSIQENIKLTKQEIASLAQETEQKWVQLSQGWEQLNNSQKETRIKEMEYELKQRRPGILNIGGSAIRETLENLDKVMGNYKKRW